MLKKSKLLLIILIALNLLLHIRIFIAASSFQKRGPAFASSADIPENYTFLMFPAQKAAIYRTEKFVPAELVGELKRAVTADYREIKSGAIGVTGEGFVSITDLTYLPAAESPELLQSWQEKITASGFYTAGRWSAKDLSGGQKQITLELIDGKHARSNTYSYNTDGEKIFSIDPEKMESGVLSVFLILIPVSFFLCSFMIWLILARAGKS